MGLDNGILMKVNRKYEAELRKMIPEETSIYTESWLATEEIIEFGIAYWRKCWNVRSFLISYGKTDDEYRYFYSKDDLKNFWKDLNYINCKKNWDTSEAFWSFKEIRDSNDYALLNIEWVIDNWDALAALGVEVYAYDSY